MVERLKSVGAVSGRLYWLCQKRFVQCQGQPPIRNSSIFNTQLFLKLDRYGYFVVYYKIALTIL